ncbi:MAG: hypothetical protein M3331_06985 [Actinomycetota bacterium]|nr:hypothetical protein [Actinomycetota bacterium]
MRARGQRIGEAERLAGAALAAGRIAIGVGIWAAPGLTARALGMKPFQGEALALARLAATRDLILGAWLGAELRGGGKPLAPAAALTACDAGDALAFALLAPRGGEELGAGLRGVAAALPATALGGWLVGRLRR